MAAPLLDLKKRIERIEKLPAMPQLASKIIQLKNDPTANVKELARLVEWDPSLAAQVMRYARSPYFGYRGEVDSVHTAIARVLGYDVVLHLAFGLATSKPFKLPMGGMLGLKAYWKHAVYASALCQALSSLQPSELRPSSGAAYLSGLLHNFGLLVIGQMFPQEYMLLSKYVKKYPDKPVVDIERRLFGIHHGQVGAWLLRAWKLPDEVVVAALHHHNPDYIGNHEVYPQLVMVSNLILKRHGLGDETNGEIPPKLLDALEIGEYMALLEAKRLLSKNEALKSMIAQMTAI